MIKPTIPMMRKSQPIRISTASVAIGGITTAARPRMMRMIPSTRKSTQCSCSDVATARCICSMSGLFIDMAGLLGKHSSDDSETGVNNSASRYRQKREVDLSEF